MLRPYEKTEEQIRRKGKLRMYGIVTPKVEKGQIIYPDESYQIRGAVFEVYRNMGNGFLEAVYQECCRELTRRQIPFLSQPALTLTFKEERLDHVYRPDFTCYDKIIVELKAVSDITNEHKAQVFNYLKATGYHLGLLVNLGHYPLATIDRIVV